MYWAKPELELLAGHYKSVDDKTASFEIRAALNLIDKEYKDMISVLPSLLPHSITFEHLWCLIPPGSLVVGQDDLDFTDIWRALSCAVKETQQGVFLFITAECIAWDGEKMGYSSRTLKVPQFSGLKTIDSLPHIPLKYHPKREVVMQKVMQRSAKAIKFWTPGSQLQEHQGTGLAEIGQDIQRYAVSKAPSEKWLEQRCSPIACSNRSVQRTRRHRPGDDAKHPTIEHDNALVAKDTRHFWER